MEDTEYRTFIKDSKYTSWKFIDTKTQNDIEFTHLNPLNEKLFNNDIFTVDPKTNEIIVLSSMAKTQTLTGVLVLDKTYGKDEKPGKSPKATKYFYKCIPHDKHLPEFLISYNITNGFSKTKIPLYVCFCFKQWTNKHPVGNIVKTIGPIDILHNFYEYHIACKNLDFPLKEFKEQSVKAMKHLKCQPNEFILKTSCDFNIEDRRHIPTYTIDNSDTSDYDDAFSIYNDSENYTIVSIYISNVTFWIDQLDLWNAFSERISTIYLPDQKRPMIPTLLSDSLCSLKKNEPRIVFTMDIKFPKCENCLSTSERPQPQLTFKNTLIEVNENLSYDNWNKKSLDTDYFTRLFKYLQPLSKETLKDSHDLIHFLMVYMNHNVAKILVNHKCGIYRNVTYTSHDKTIPDTLPNDVYNYLNQYRYSVGHYVNFEHVSNHEFLKLDSYLHITSPIRRLVDLLNMVSIQQHMDILTFKDSVECFYQKWHNRIEYINTTMRSIRKVQSDCHILSLFENDKQNNYSSITNKFYTGYVFDKVKRTDLQFQYNVYIPDLKLNTRITTLSDFDNYEEQIFKLFMFTTEYSVKKKIKLQVIKP